MKLLFKLNLWLFFSIFIAAMTVFAPYGYDLAIRSVLDKNTVKVVTYNKKMDYQWTGTGFQIKTKKGLFIVTNRHVCKDSKEVFIDYNNKRTKLKVLKVSKVSDLCLIEPLEGLRGLVLGSSSYAGQRVYSLGYASSIPVKQLSKGEISGFADYMQLPVKGGTSSKGVCMEFNGFMHRVQTRFGWKNMCVYKPVQTVTTLKVNNGSSGSAIMNLRFQVVGVVFVKSDHFTAGAVPLSALHRFLNNYTKGLK